MSSLISFSIDCSKIDRASLKDGKYLALTMSVNDTPLNGNNVSVFQKQTAEESKAKEPRKYYGNGRVFWTDGKVTKYEETQGSSAPASNNQQGNDDADLPF
jgi:hypothetical protein